MEYLVVIEKGSKGYGAHVPDLPGCIAAARTRREVVRLIRGAMRLHIKTMRAAGEQVPLPVSESEIVRIRAA